MDDKFLKLPFSVLGVSKWKDISISPADKLVYSFLLSRIRYFVWEQGGEYYETQEEMAKALGMDVQVVRRSVLKWINLGVVKATKSRHQGRQKWVYHNILPVGVDKQGDRRDNTPHRI